MVKDYVLTIHINLCFKNLLDNVFHFYIVGVKRKAGAPIDKTNELWLRLCCYGYGSALIQMAMLCQAIAMVGSAVIQMARPLQPPQKTCVPH